MKSREQLEHEILKIFDANLFVGLGNSKSYVNGTDQTVYEVLNLFEQEMKELKLQLEAQDANVEILISQKEQQESLEGGI